MTATVAWLRIAPVKGLRLLTCEELAIDGYGARGDRRYVLVDPGGNLVNGKRLPRLVQVVAACSDGSLTLRFPDGATVSGEPRRGAPTTILAYGESRDVHIVEGPWSEALSSWAGTPLRLVEPAEGDGVDRRREAGVTLLSVASLHSLGRAAGLDWVDDRRFRMTVGVAGVESFTEESWLGRTVRAGEAVVRVHGNVGRCAVTTVDPESGDADLQTLHLLRHLRHGVESTEPLPFGVWAEVITPGLVRVGDAIRVD